jgi:predicted metal-dependent HD superfamily phosphohydrolase
MGEQAGRELEVRWHEAVRELGGAHDPGDLADRYAEPHRGYHNTDHVLAVVRDVNAKVLRTLAERDPLYVTPHARERWEARAKANLAAEISSLGDPP